MNAISKISPTLSLVFEVPGVNATFTSDVVTLVVNGSYSKTALSRETWNEIVAASAVYDGILAGRSVPCVTEILPTAEPTTPEIGAPFAGGFFAGLDMDDKRYAIVVAPKAEGHFVDVDWKTALERCASVRAGGFDDWRAPAKDEFYMVCRGLGPNVRRAEAFECGQAEAFDERWYWSSTEYDSDLAWGRHFGYGNLLYVGKFYRGQVRAIRKVLI